MNIKRIKQTVLGAILITVASPALAAFSCSADVSALLIYGDGGVNVKHSERNAWTMVCSLKDERQGVSVATCAMWVSTLQNAKKENKKLTFYYRTGATYGACSELPTYGDAPAPVYIGIFQ